MLFILQDLHWFFSMDVSMPRRCQLPGFVQQAAHAPWLCWGGKCRDATILGMKGKPQGCLNLSVSQAPPGVPMDPPHQLVFP